MSVLRSVLIAALSVAVVGLVVAGLVAPNLVSMPVTVRTGVADPGPGAGRAAPAVTGTVDRGVATPVFGTVGVEGDLAAGDIRFRLAPVGNPAAAVEWTLAEATHYRVEAPLVAGEYELTVTTTVDGEEHSEQQTVTLEPGQPVEISVLVSSAPWLIFFLPVPAY